MRDRSPVSQQIFDRVIGDQTSGAIVPTHTFSGNFVSGTKFPLLPNQSVQIFNASAQVFVLEGAGLCYLQALNIYVQFYDGTGTALVGPVILLASNSWPAQSATVNGNLVNGQGTGTGVEASGDPLMEMVSNMLITGLTVVGGPSAAFFSIDAAFDVYNASASDATPYAIVSSLHSIVPRWLPRGI